MIFAKTSRNWSGCGEPPAGRWGNFSSPTIWRLIVKAMSSFANSETNVSRSSRWRVNHWYAGDRPAVGQANFPDRGVSPVIQKIDCMYWIRTIIEFSDCISERAKLNLEMVR